MAALPKFGDWDTGNDTSHFTAKFEVVRSERGSGSTKQGVGRGNERLGYGDGRGNEGLVHGIGHAGCSGDRSVSGGGGSRRFMNPNDPLENPAAFFGNRGIKPSNISYQHNSRYNNSNSKKSNNYLPNLNNFPVVNSQLRSSRSSAPPSLTTKHNRFKQPSPSATPPRARVNPSGIPANRGQPTLPKFGEWDEEAEGFTSVFKKAAMGQTTQIGVDPVKMEVDDDVRRNVHKKYYHNDTRIHQYFCGLFRRQHKRK